MTRAIGPTPLTPAEIAAFVAAARSYIGTRWRHQGRDRRGLDCGGLLVVCMRAIGRDVHDPRGYGRLPYRGSLEATMRSNYGDPQPMPCELQVGDAGVFEVAADAPDHVGIIGDYVHGGLSLIHAYAVNREVVEAPLDDAWRAKLVEVYR